MIEPSTGWANADALRFYATHRHTPEELYLSERTILLPALEGCESVLDVGCAAGGFSEILHTLKPSLRYVGLDSSEAMLATARKRYPTRNFQHGQANALPFPDSTFDLVLCTGVLLHNPDFAAIIRECYRVARRGCILDLPRYPADGRPTHAIMRLAERFSDGIAQGNIGSTDEVPYMVADPVHVLEILRTLRPSPQHFTLTGYPSKPGRGTYDPVTHRILESVYVCVMYLGKVMAA